MLMQSEADTPSAIGKLNYTNPQEGHSGVLSLCQDTVGLVMRNRHTGKPMRGPLQNNAEKTLTTYSGV